MSRNDFALGGLLDRTPPEQSRSAPTGQLARPMSETGVDPGIDRALHLSVPPSAQAR
ncbi:hypothetical protein OG851_42285 (plasmid) [Streptomyces sp. NBC_00161]|uniref:hypothetical protein n=1 Tax=Streptomyces sp. NBC_00161 TaxID=2975671 RepID=UPI00324507E8